MWRTMYPARYVLLLLPSLLVYAMAGHQGHSNEVLGGQHHNRYSLTLPHMQRKLIEAAFPDGTSRALHSYFGSGSGKHKVVIISAVTLLPCDSSLGHYVSLLSMQNKENYAKMHDYGFRWSIQQMKNDMWGPWNKIGALLTTLEAVSENDAEWIMWADEDTLFLNMTNPIPTERYEGKDFVFWNCGDLEFIKNANADGFNAGVMMFRNSATTRAFIAEVAEYGRRWLSDSFRESEEAEFKALLTNYKYTLYEQNVITYLLHKNPAYAEQALCDNTESLQRYFFWNWTPANLTTEPYPYLMHWPGCQFCHAAWAKLNFKDCIESFVTVFQESQKQSTVALGEGVYIDWMKVVESKPVAMQLNLKHGN